MKLLLLVLVFLYISIHSSIAQVKNTKDSLLCLTAKSVSKVSQKYDYAVDPVEYYTIVPIQKLQANLLNYNKDSLIAVEYYSAPIKSSAYNGDEAFSDENHLLGSLIIHRNQPQANVELPLMNAIRKLVISEVNNAEIVQSLNAEDITQATKVLLIDTLYIMNCKDVKINLRRLKVKKYLAIINCSFRDKFTLNVESDSLNNIIFEKCDFSDVRDFEISNSGRAHVFYKNSLWPEKMRLKLKWYEYSKAAYPKDFFHYPLRSIDTLFRRYTDGYDLDIPAEENKSNLYKECMVKLRQYQRYASDQFEYELADSIYRTSKELETYYYKYLNEQNAQSSFTNRMESWVYYKFNSFMGWYCGYGTLPIDSLYNSAYIVIIFALFYIIFPTRMQEEKDTWDFEHLYVLLSLYSGQNAPLDTFFRAFQSFKTEHPTAGLRQFLEVHTKDNLIEFRNSLPKGSAIYIDAFLNSYENKNMLLRFFLWFYAYPFLVQVKFLHLLDQLGEKRFASLSKMGKQVTIKSIWSPIMVLTAVFVFFSWLLVRIPQGLFISINAFSTLGFGNLPLRGLCKYLAVIEGLIGWFTLSLFSITYVNILMR